MPKHSLKLLFQAKKLVKDGNMYTCFTKNLFSVDKSTEIQSYEDLEKIIKSVDPEEFRGLRSQTELDSIDTALFLDLSDSK